jgi:TRAP-type C4-dicarboxylate transport system permease small subunit
MKYPSFLERFNQVTGILAGALIVIMGLLATMEGILRWLFSSPTSWSLDVSQYFLIWTIFLGTAYAFQEKSHVSVDLVKDFVGQRWGTGAKRVLIVIGYVLALVFILVLAWDSADLIFTAIKLEKLTIGTVQIPIVYLYAAMMAGSVFMLVTVVCIILDVIGGGEKYL